MELIISIILNVILFILLIYQIGLKKINILINQLVIEAEKLIPGQTMEQKADWIIKNVKENSLFAHFITLNLLNKIIEASLALLKKDDHENNDN